MIHASSETLLPPSKTLAEQVYRRIRAGIIRGELPPGAPLRSNELCAAYGVGISPLREALSRLVAERLVTSIGQRGFRVAPLTIEDVRDTMETRVLTESEALCKSIERGGVEWEAAIVASLHTVERLPIPTGPGPEAEHWAAAHRVFHGALLAACGSNWLIVIATLLSDQAERHRFVELKHTRGREHEHREIAEATLARRTSDAVAALERHYRATAESVVAILQTSRA